MFSTIYCDLNVGIKKTDFKNLFHELQNINPFIKYINNEKSILEESPLEKACKKKELVIYKHKGFWQCMDTLRDKNYLENLWANGAPWKTW